MIDITYNRKTRHYEWTEPETGEIFTFPSGRQNKAAAFQFAVFMLDPDLHGAAERAKERQPHMERVIWKGVEIVINQGVEVPAVPLAGQVVGLVDSSDGYGRYSIANDNGYIVCNCASWDSAPMTAKGTRICKHIAAWQLWRQVRETRF